jgi:hypothetical protein
MAEWTRVGLLQAIRDVVEASPFSLRPSPTPFDLSRVPQDVIDGSYRLAVAGGRVEGWMNGGEGREDTLEVFVARTHGADVTDAHDALTTLASSLVSAVAHAGQAQDFDLMDEGRDIAIESDGVSSYLVARITLPVAYAARL